MMQPLLLLAPFILVLSLHASPRIVITFHNASLNAAAIAPENTEIVKQYGRRLVLRIAGNTSEWVQQALGGEDCIESIEQDALASASLFANNTPRAAPNYTETSAHSLAPASLFANNTPHAVSNYTETSAHSMAPASLFANNTPHAAPNYTETSAHSMLLLPPYNPISMPPSLTGGWNLNESERYSLHIRSFRHLSDGYGATMAIIDSGIAEAAKSLFHPAAGYDFISSPDYSNKPHQARNPDYTDPGDQGPTCPTPSWHGTKVTSVAAAVAPGATLTVMRVLGQCGLGFSSDIADAIVWAAGGQINGLSANPFPASIISLSLAGKSPCPSYLQSAVNQARSLGAVVIAAAGNAAQNVSLYFPANCYGVVAIGASTRQGTLATYSNWGHGLAFNAQGGDALNPIPVLTVANGQLRTASATGTSFAAPHVAGMIALLAGMGFGSDSIALMPLSVCDGAFCKGILSTGITYARSGPYYGPISLPHGEGVNSSLAYASAACSGITGTRWPVPKFSGNTNQGSADTKKENFYCDTGCFVTKIKWCEEYVQLTCSNAKPSQIFGQRDYPLTCNNGDDVSSLTGFTKIIGHAGNDVNGMEIFKSGGGDVKVGCGGCQTHVELSCLSHTDETHRIITGFYGHFTSGYRLHAFGLYCSEYTCPAATYMSTSNSVCNTCNWPGDGMYTSNCGGKSKGDASACATNCPVNQYRGNCGNQNAGACYWCGDCPLGSRFTNCMGGGLSDNSVCVACEAGKYSAGGKSRECTPCEAGKYNPSPSSGACLACPTGKYNPSTGSVALVACLNCDKGKYNTNTARSSGSDCTPCQLGYYSAVEGLHTLCPFCAAGTYADQEGMTACSLCSAGTYEQYTQGLISPDMCTKCRTGTFSTASGARDPATCQACERGRFSASDGRSACDRCAAGTYGATTGLSACLACEAGKFSSAMGLSGACTSCQAGKYNAVAGAPSLVGCISCEAGHYSAAQGATACQQCPIGMSAGGTGRSECKTCGTGTFTTTPGTIMCEACVPITNCAVATEYRCIPETGKECVVCEHIFACEYGGAACFANNDPSTPACLCRPGFEMVGGRCRGCPPETFKPVSGNGACFAMTSPQCPTGRFLQRGTAFANSACVDCPPLPPNARQGASGCEWTCAAGFDNNSPAV